MYRFLTVVLVVLLLVTDYAALGLFKAAAAVAVHIVLIRAFYRLDEKRHKKMDLENGNSQSPV